MFGEALATIILAMIVASFVLYTFGFFNKRP